MAQQAHVPKFGNWETGGNVPYTQYFDNARKGRVAGGQPINPNDPAENPEAFANTDLGRRPHGPDQRLRHHQEKSPNHRNEMGHGSGSGTDNARARHERKGSRDGERRYQQDVVEKSPHHHHMHDGAEKSPYHRPSAGRARLRVGGRGDETPERGSAVPKFGEWDERDPSSADGYTHIFNVVREEKQKPSPLANNIAPYPPKYPHNKNPKSYDDYESSSCSCFGWCK